MPSPDEAGSIAAEALEDFFGQLWAFVYEIFARFFGNLYLSFAQMSANRWTKVTLSVVGYLIARPYIEAFFKKMAERDHRKQMEKERKKREEMGGKKAKVSANALRGGASAAKSADASGKVLGEVENTDDEVEEEDFATASGVPEWTENARKRGKKNKKNIDAVEEQKAKLSEEQIMELLDWSDEEAEAAAAAAK